MSLEGSSRETEVLARGGVRRLDCDVGMMSKAKGRVRIT